MVAVSSKVVLVVDDDKDLRDTLVDVLQEEGYEAIAASSGQEALKLLQEGARPGIILLDMMMPGMDGQRFRTEQMQNGAWTTIPTVIFSAHVKAAEAASTMGVAGVLQKPVRMEALLEMVSRFVPPR
jgi:CheY-like chemotaxis protein